MKLINYLCMGTVLGLFVFTAVTNAEDECGAAVDAADSMNLNQKDCDYTKEGLNGVLHKAFKKGSEGAVLETSTENSVSDKKSITHIAAKPAQAETAPFLLNVEIDSWSGSALARTQLMSKAMEKCAQGFSVEREHYRPMSGKIVLSVEFRCAE